MFFSRCINSRKKYKILQLVRKCRTHGHRSACNWKQSEILVRDYEKPLQDVSCQHQVLGKLECDYKKDCYNKYSAKEWAHVCRPVQLPTLLLGALVLCPPPLPLTRAPFGFPFSQTQGGTLGRLYRESDDFSTRKHARTFTDTVFFYTHTVHHIHTMQMGDILLFNSFSRDGGGGTQVMGERP